MIQTEPKVLKYMITMIYYMEILLNQHDWITILKSFCQKIK